MVHWGRKKVVVDIQAIIEKGNAGRRLEES